MFRKLISRFDARRSAEAAFEARLEQEQTGGHVLETAPDRSWYISLGFITTRDELANSPAWVMKLYDKAYDNRIVCEAHLVHYISTKTVLIGDIEAHFENRGYGSIMLSTIITLAETLNIREIKGNLTSTDSDHFDKLEHFYKKHGFHVKFNPGKISGEVILKLPK